MTTEKSDYYKRVQAHQAGMMEQRRPKYPATMEHPVFARAIEGSLEIINGRKCFVYAEEYNENATAL